MCGNNHKIPALRQPKIYIAYRNRAPNFVDERRKAVIEFTSKCSCAKYWRQFKSCRSGNLKMTAGAILSEKYHFKCHKYKNCCQVGHRRSLSAMMITALNNNALLIYNNFFNFPSKTVRTFLVV